MSVDSSWTQGLVHARGPRQYPDTAVDVSSVLTPARRGIDHAFCAARSPDSCLVASSAVGFASQALYVNCVIQLHKTRLESLRDELQRRGDRPSLNLPSADLDLIEALSVVEEYSALCETMYLMMAADHRVLNVERMVLRGALDLLSNGRVRSAHMESMIDASSKRVAQLGEQRCLEECLARLREDPVRAEMAVVLAAAVAAADNFISPEERELYEKLIVGLGMTHARGEELLVALLKPDAQV